MADSTDLVAGFSIWAVPGKPSAQELEDVIKTYAERLQTPPFLPHMTVLSGVKALSAEEVTVKLSELADSMHVLDVEIQTLTFKDELYFQCVFGLLKLTSELRQAHGRAKEVYAVERKEEFMPHVSFIYGDLASEARAELAKELQPQLDGRLQKMDKLQLWRTLGPVESWELGCCGRRVKKWRTQFLSFVVVKLATPTVYTEPQSSPRSLRFPRSAATRAVQSKHSATDSPSRPKGDVGKLVYCFLREYPTHHSSAPGGFPLAREPQPEPLTEPYDPSHHYNGLVRRPQHLQLRQRPRHRRVMPRQKDTKRIDPTRARRPEEPVTDAEPHNVFKVSGSPIISPRSIRHCLEEPGFDIDGKPRKHSNGGVTLPHPPISKEDALVAAAAAAVQAKEAQKALEAEQAANAKLQGLSGVQLVVHQMLATHTHTLAQLGVERAEFPNTRLSLKQIARTMNDVHYWKIWESDSIDIGIFFMPPNSTIPLHNHPGMSVVTRVLYGAATVTSYDIMSDTEVQRLEAGSEIVYEDATFSSDAVNPEKGSVSWARISRQGQFGQETTTWLDPRRFNLHNIQASSDIGCAMLDIMVPPYDNANRDCHHFQVLEEKMVQNERIFKMLESIKPDNHMDPPTSNSTANSSPLSS
ncbi:hypothetical protein PC128_g18369 [Phytophthora cactorum]|nr:hypothetical protein PC128_g18369 [Phytophthora cactorum]